ncbi:hypothetical protein EV421DRAFT_1847089 [Armillaria borealis]|uniref:Secreted protein n=1 Tax=Armillaria borealis TaxID=47425 RepID=A0AA39MGE0_9AGAR|nr:hypothetical protein EV421DRAFT_1847089 [Armillaria borealis]
MHLLFFMFCMVAYFALVAPTEHILFAPTLDTMDLIILDYIDDVVVLDYMDCLHTNSDLQTLLLYYLMYHSFSHPALIHAAQG